jgi:DNA polymerase-3 subunit epsilon
LINPLVPISAEVSAIHGITDAKVQSCQLCHGIEPRETHDEAVSDHSFKPWPIFKQLAPSLAKGFSDCDFAGKKVRYDLQIMDHEMRRAGQPWSYAGARIIDADRLEQLAEPRSLSHLYKKYTGKDHEGAHGALADVRASSEVIIAQLERYDVLPRDLTALHELSWPGWIDGEGKFRYINGVACFSQWGKFANRPMRDPEVNRPGRNGQTYWDFILTGTFSEGVKELARAAKLGKFPEDK